MTPELTYAAMFTLAQEGVYTVDQGGPTCYGVTQQRYDRYRLDAHLPTRDVRQVEMHEVLDLLVRGYWRASGCDRFAEQRPRLALLHLDFAYNSGPLRAVVKLQDTLGVAADGTFGPVTEAAARACDETATCRQYLQARARFLLALTTQPKHEASRKGWLSRLRWCARAVGLTPEAPYA